MKNTKRGLSILLTLTMLITSVGIGLGTITLKAEVPKAESVSKATPSTAVTFYVPEVIYLTPSLTTTNSFQYYVDSNTSGTLDSSRNKGTGTVYFYCASATATNVSISVSGGSVSSWSMTTQNATTFNGTINTGSVATAQAQGVESYLTWTATYYVNGEAKTATAQTCVYAPNCQPVGAVARFNNTYGTDNFASAISWISGVHGYSVATRAGNYNPRTASNSLYSLGATVTPPVAGAHTNPGSWVDAAANGSFQYQSKDASDDGTLYSNSPHGLLTVDVSRYSNMSQIPNFTTGFMVTDDQNNGSCTSYLVDYTGTDHNGNGFDGNNDNVWSETNDRPAKWIDGTTDAPSTQRQENIRYNGTWNRAISVVGSQELRAKGLLLCQDGSDEACVSTCTYLTLTKTDKSTLRSAVRLYTNYGLQAVDYPSGTWGTYAYELAYANQRLTNPKYSADVSTTNLVNAYNALVKNTYTATITHTATNGKFSVNDTVLTFNSGDTVTANPNSYAGYTSTTSTQTWNNRRANISYTYSYTANTNTVYKVNHYKVNVPVNGWDFDSQDTLYGTTDTTVTAPINTYPGFYVSEEGLTVHTGNVEGDGSLVLSRYYRRYNYNITFNANGGTGGSGVTSMIFGATLTAPSAGTRVGYTLNTTGYTNGWSPTVPATVGVGDATYTAQWTANTYTVAYNGNTNTGGSTASSSHTYDVGKALTSNGFTKTGYSFAGWNTAANGSGTSYTNGQSVSNLSASQGATVTLYAKWTANPYAVTFNANGGSGSMSNQSITFGQSANLTTNVFTRTGYSFAGWATSSGGGVAYTNGASYTMSTEGTTLYAVWTVNTYYVLFDANTGSGSMSNQGITYNTSANLTANAFSKTGYTFAGWNTAANGSGTAYANQASYGPIGAANVTLYARWTANSYTVAFNGNGSTSGSTGDSSHAYDVSSNLTSNGFAKTGNTFLGWSTNSGATTPTYTNGQSVLNLTSTPNDIITFYAVWSVNHYNITFNANGGTGGTGPTSMLYGATITAPTVTRTGYSFSNWSPAVDSTVPAANSTYTAQWAANTYTVTFNANGGSVSPNSKNVTYDSTYGTLPIPELEGYSFDGWYTQTTGGTVVANGTAVAITSAQTVYAHWTMVPVSFTALNTVVTSYSSNLVDSLPVLSGDGTNMGNVYGYGDATQRQATVDAYDDAVALQLQAPLPNTAANRTLLSDAQTALAGAINTLLANPNTAVYTYVNVEVEASGEINLNRYTTASLGELQTAVSAVVTGKGAGEQATINSYAAAMYNQRVGSSALVAYQDTKAPKLDVYETTDTMLASGITVNGFDPEDFGDISYVYPAKAYYTYYCYTNSESPALLVKISDLADSNGRLSYPTNIDVSKVSGTVNAGWMSYTYDGGTRAGTVTEGSATISNTRYAGYTIGMNYDGTLGEDYYKQAGYLVLKPQFVQAGGKQFARYTISGVDDSSASGNLADTTSLAGGTTAYQNGVAITTANQTWTPLNTITIYVEYRNAMSLDGGVWYDDGRVGGTINAFNTVLPDTGWVVKDYVFRTSGGATNDEMIGLNDTVYPSNDPNYGKDGLACFYYFLNDTSDASVIADFASNGQYSATRMMMSNIKANPSGYNTQNWPKAATSISGYNPGTVNRLMYVHLVDRWGNVFNRLVKTNNVDAAVPSFSGVAYGAATLNESGGSGVSLLKLYQYAYEGGPQFVIPCYSDKLITELSVINEPDNILDISVGSATVADGSHNRFTLYVKDKAGNEKTQTVFTDASGNLSITVNDPENMSPPQGKSMGAKAMSNADSNVYTFLLNDTITVNLNNPMQAETYTITFNLNGATSQAIEPITLEEGAEVTAPADPVREGYTFNGWLPVLPTVMPAENIECVAQWSRIPTLVAAEGSTTVINNENHFIYGLEQYIRQEDFENAFVGILGDGRLQITPYSEFGEFGTGTKVELVDNATDAVVETYYIVIFGDVNGDGVANAVDGDIVYNVDNWFIEWNYETQSFLFAAADLSGDGYVNTVDGDIIYNVDNWFMYIDQTTGLAYEA